MRKQKKAKGDAGKPAAVTPADEFDGYYQQPQGKQGDKFRKFGFNSKARKVGGMRRG